MDTDLALVIGMVLAVLAIPSFLAAWSEDRVPRNSAIMALIAIGLIVYALNAHPGGYRLQQIPDVIARVIARLTS